MTPEEKQAIIDENEAALEKLKIEQAERKRHREMYGEDVPLYKERRVKKSSDVDLRYRTQRDARPREGNDNIITHGDATSQWNSWFTASFNLHAQRMLDRLLTMLGEEAGIMEDEIRQHIAEEIGALRADLKVEKAAENIVDLPDFRRRA